MVYPFRNGTRDRSYFMKACGTVIMRSPYADGVKENPCRGRGNRKLDEVGGGYPAGCPSEWGSPLTSPISNPAVTEVVF